MLPVQVNGKQKFFDGVEVRVARVRAGFTLEDLAAEVKIQVADLSKYERNRQVPSEAHLAKLAAFSPLCLKGSRR